MWEIKLFFKLILFFAPPCIVSCAHARDDSSTCVWSEGGEERDRMLVGMEKREDEEEIDNRYYTTPFTSIPPLSVGQSKGKEKGGLEKDLPCGDKPNLFCIFLERIRAERNKHEKNVVICAETTSRKYPRRRNVQMV